VKVPDLLNGEFFLVDEHYVHIYSTRTRRTDSHWSNYELTDDLPMNKVESRTVTPSIFERLASFWQVPKSYTQWRTWKAEILSSYNAEQLGMPINADTLERALQRAATLRLEELADRRAMGIYVPSV